MLAEGVIGGFAGSFHFSAVTKTRRLWLFQHCSNANILKQVNE